MELLSTEYRRCISNGKQHNRGQDGAGFASIKLDMEPGERYIVECDQIMLPIQDVFAQINDRVNEEMAAHPNMRIMALQKANIPYVENCFRHVRYGTFGKIVSRVFILLRQNNWMHRNPISGNFQYD
jgi:amidophosphoribosyltransferase